MTTNIMILSTTTVVMIMAMIIFYYYSYYDYKLNFLLVRAVRPRKLWQRDLGLRKFQPGMIVYYLGFPYHSYSIMGPKTLF